MPGMRRREFITLLGGAAVAAGLRPLEARAQGSTKPRRIGVLSQDLAGAHPTPVFQAFLDGLRELGWLEGHNLAIEGSPKAASSRSRVSLPSLWL